MKKTALALAVMAVILLAVVAVRLVTLCGSVRTPQRTVLTREEVSVEKIRLEAALDSRQRELASNMPRSGYLVINTTRNEFYLYRDRQMIKKDLCSTGSYMLLKNGDHQQWIFRTPKGVFRVRGKTTRPVWRKPDWAFIEAGLKPPPAGHPSRYEAGVLGSYALDLGDGYLIHGTLYQRFLGLPVTHGCVRLGDENLELVYRTVPVGGRVYIF